MAIHAKGSTVLRGACVVVDYRKRADPADILIVDGWIRDIGAPGMRVPDGTDVVDVTDMLAHPGLINAHTHASQFYGRSAGDRMTLELLLTAEPFWNQYRTLEQAQLSATVCAAEMVLKGCTSAYEQYAESPGPTVEGTNAIARGYANVGLRAVVAPLAADISFFDAIPGMKDAMPAELRGMVERFGTQPADAMLKVLEDTAKNWLWHNQDIHLSIGPSIPHHCTKAFFCGCGRIAKDFGLRVTSHVSESKVQALVTKQKYGRTLVQQLDAWGMLNPQFTAGHAIWLDPDDIRILGERGASISHNAGSNMRLGNGMFPLRTLLDAGANVAIGSDGVGCSDNQNIYEAMRYASMMSKVQSPFIEEWASADEIYTAATKGGAAALGLEKVGELKVGYKADIVLIDLISPNWIPHNWSINQIVQAEDSSSIRHVMIGGVFVVYNRTLTTVDLRNLAMSAEVARERDIELGARAKVDLPALEDFVNGYCADIASQPYHVEKYLRGSRNKTAPTKVV
ncbi:amidohydrolase family protein [Aureimonas altamirensis]|uniref:amidohydrolase family protein n=1 Tax=Aureimonas altamirensis TaxID=370622 RepID=UPI001E4283D8|nr:amidohydrolase family protein [Aureimonas altamirensis]UHD46428.1 amidohydrolase family protein [Aureimonas altamirensis]